MSRRWNSAAMEFACLKWQIESPRRQVGLFGNLLQESIVDAESWFDDVVGMIQIEPLDKTGNRSWHILTSTPSASASDETLGTAKDMLGMQFPVYIAFNDKFISAHTTYIALNYNTITFCSWKFHHHTMELTKLKALREFLRQKRANIWRICLFQLLVIQNDKLDARPSALSHKRLTLDIWLPGRLHLGTPTR